MAGVIRGKAPSQGERAPPHESQIPPVLIRVARTRACGVVVPCRVLPQARVAVRQAGQGPRVLARQRKTPELPQIGVGIHPVALGNDGDARLVAPDPDVHGGIPARQEGMRPALPRPVAVGRIQKPRSARRAVEGLVDLADQPALHAVGVRRGIKSHVHLFRTRQPGIAEDRRRAPFQRIPARRRPVAARRARIARDEVRHLGQQIRMAGRRHLAAECHSFLLRRTARAGRQGAIPSSPKILMSTRRPRAEASARSNSR